VRARGLGIGLAATVPATTVPEARLVELFRHELRWGRTIRAIAPLSYAASALQYPLAWALLAVVLAGGAAWTIVLFAAAWALRARAARAIDRALGLTKGQGAVSGLWHIPLRDLMSMAVLMASYMGDRVEWRGRILRAAAPPRATGSLGIEQA
jgi:ceramide glucosyltransferase